MTEELDRREDRRKSLAWLVIVVAGLAYLIIKNPQATWHTIMMLLGFGAVIFVHELGHFVAAKAVGIKVEAFSLGFGWVVVGIRRVEGGYRVRVLPDLMPAEDGEGALCFTIPAARAVEGDTEYRLSLIPLGGFVKMLGQEDMVEDKPSDDPRAYGNKPVWMRCVVIAAGVTMNVIVGGIVFMIVFTIGIQKSPGMVGDVSEGLPAYEAGLRAGDEIVAIDGKTDYVEFMDVRIAGALADPNEKIAMTVRHPDGSQDDYEIAPKMEKKRGMRIFGIAPAFSRTVQMNIPDKEEEVLTALTSLGVRPGDTVVAINGTKIEHDYQLHTAMFPKSGVAAPETLKLTFERVDEDGGVAEHDIEVDMILYDSTHGRVLGMAPRLRVAGVNEDGQAEKAGVLQDDIIIQFGSRTMPLVSDMHAVCAENEGKPVELKVLRVEEEQMVEKVLEVTPQGPKLNLLQDVLRRLSGDEKGKAIIGISLVADLATPVVSDCSAYGDGYDALALPAGAAIVSVAGNEVNSWEQIIDELRERGGEEVDISYRGDEGQGQQSIRVQVPEEDGWIGFAYRPDFGELFDLPWEPVKRLYKAKDWRESLRMGAGAAGGWIVHTYLNIRAMVTRTVSVKHVSGPVGILKMTYTVAAERTFIEFCHFMAMINVLIAVFNFLPVPVLDGGHMVFLLIEKAKGSPVPPKVQYRITCVGFALLIGFVLFVTFNDIMRMLK